MFQLLPLLLSSLFFKIFYFLLLDTNEMSLFVSHYCVDYNHYLALADQRFHDNALYKSTFYLLTS